MTSHVPPASPATTGTQRLVLLGASEAHLEVLVRLATQPLPGTEVVLAAPHANLVLPNMLPGFVAGRYALTDCAIPLEPLVRRAGIRWLDRNATAVDVAQQQLQLDDGSTLSFDWLSAGTNPVQDRSALERELPGAREHGLFLRPLEAFAALWPRVAAMGEEQALRIAVIGAGDGGVEVALAARQRLPHAAVTLVSGTDLLDTLYTPPVQQRMLALMKQRNVTVLQDKALSLTASHVQLGCGASLACDVPILALGAQAPLWLAASGLALDTHGFPTVDMYQRSTSHGRVFAAQMGATLTHNLAAALAGAALKHHHPPPPPSLQAGGGRHAVGNWRNFSTQGRWLWWFKRWQARRFVARFDRGSAN